MKYILLQILLLAALGPCLAAPFRNLDFQSPNVSKLQGPSVKVEDAIPGWRLQQGDIPISDMLYNGLCLTCPAASLYGPEKPRRGDTFSFSINAGATYDGPKPTYFSESVHQTGDVPQDAHSLQFVGSLGDRLDLLHVYLGGQELPLVTLESAGSKRQFGADVTAWAGKTAELRFTIDPVVTSLPSFSSVGLGDIRFSPVALVPEPSTWALLGVGGAFLLMVARSRKA